MRIGVLAVQGNFREHVAMLRRLGAEAVERGVFIRAPRVREVGAGVEALAGLDGEPGCARGGSSLRRSIPS